jgi:hypothetical protein
VKIGEEDIEVLHDNLLESVFHTGDRNNFQSLNGERFLDHTSNIIVVIDEKNLHRIALARTPARESKTAGWRSGGLMVVPNAGGVAPVPGAVVLFKVRCRGWAGSRYGS